MKKPLKTTDAMQQWLDGMKSGILRPNVNKLYSPENRFNEMLTLSYPVLSHYDKHVLAMTREKLDSKSDIAAELGWRDWQIEQLLKRVQDLKILNDLLTETGLSVHKSNSETSAQRTLSRLGYTDNGGEEWTPPLGKPPRFDLIDELRKEIAELKSQKHINEIKAQAIEEAVKKADRETYIGVTGGDFPPQKQYRAEILAFANNLRSKK
jgi:hypothetical protein